MEIGGLDARRIVVIDTETTGLKPGKDEVLSLAVIDGEGSVLFHDLFRPRQHKSWGKAGEINDITWADVEGKPTIQERFAEIEELFAGAALVVGYNLKFDLAMLEGEGLVIPDGNRYDVMTWYQLQNKGQKVTLVQCAARFGYVFDAHDALEDARATLHCFKSMVHPGELAKVGKPKAKRHPLWLLLAVPLFVVAAILAVATSTAVTPGGIARGVLWTCLFAVGGIACVWLWRRK